MGFFNKFSFDNLFGGDEGSKLPMSPPPEIPEQTFIESENMIAAKDDIQKYNKELKEYENKIRDIKIKIANAKRLYQSECTHSVLTEAKQESSPMFNDYQFKCEHCGAELFNHQRTVNYLTTLIDLLSKAGKMLESMTVNGIFINSAEDMYADITRLIYSCNSARDYVLERKSTDYNDTLKSRVHKKKTKKENEQ